MKASTEVTEELRCVVRAEGPAITRGHCEDCEDQAFDLDYGVGSAFCDLQ